MATPGDLPAASWRYTLELPPERLHDAAEFISGCALDAGYEVFSATGLKRFTRAQDWLLRATDDSAREIEITADPDDSVLTFRIRSGGSAALPETLRFIREYEARLCANGLLPARVVK